MAIVQGDQGDNVLEGTPASDTLIGGMGDDIYLSFGPDDVIVEHADGGVDAVRLSYRSSPEYPFFIPDHVEGVKYAAYVVGNEEDNVIVKTNVADGGAGNDYFDINLDNYVFRDFDVHISGGLGDDRIVTSVGGVYEGGEGGDTYFVNSHLAYGLVSAPILVDRASDAGVDTVVANAGYYLGERGDPTYPLLLDLRGEATDGIENVVIRFDEQGGFTSPLQLPDPSQILVHANALDNRVAGSASAEIAYGEDGDDLIDLRRGHDWAFGGAGDDRLHGGDGQDRLYGDSEDVLATNGGRDKLYGGANHDALYGGAGNDILDGGAGNDWLRGGQGADKFVFEGAWGDDRIADFQSGRDLIVLSGQGLALSNLRLTATDIDQDGQVDDILIMTDRDGLGAIAVLNHAPDAIGAADFLF